MYRSAGRGTSVLANLVGFISLRESDAQAILVLCTAHCNFHSEQLRISQVIAKGSQHHEEEAST